MKNHSIQIERQSGFTLLEILVTVIILAIGLLGVAALQNSSIKLSYDSYLRSQASLLSYDLMDRVRSNPDENANYAFDTIAGGSTPAGSPTACISNNCSPSDMARADIAAWFEEASSIFTDGKFSLKQTSSTSPAPGLIPPRPAINHYEIKINWQDRYEVEDAQSSANQVDNPSINNNRAEFVFFFDVRVPE